MNLGLIGTSYRYSPIEIREKLSFPKCRLLDALASLRAYYNIEEAVILSTCNRVEIYAGGFDKEALSALKRFLARYHGIGFESIEPYLYTYTGKEALRHLFRVAAGLDSQILGEAQIVEQVEYAWQAAQEAFATDAVLDAAFSGAIKTSLKVRHQTGISSGDVSIATMAVDLINRRRGLLIGKKIILIGAGNVTELLIGHLKDKGARLVIISNKNYEKAIRLAEEFCGTVARLDALKSELRDADIVISATSSPHVVLGTAEMREAKKPLLIIDLAVPRDVAPEVKGLKGVELFSLDDLGGEMDAALFGRRRWVPAALDIIEKEVEHICSKKDLKSERERVLLP